MFSSLGKIIRTRGTAFSWWLVLGGFCVFSTAVAGQAVFWVNQSFWAVFGLWGAWNVRPLLPEIYPPLPGKSLGIYPMKPALRLGRVFTSSVLILFLITAVVLLLSTSPWPLVGVGAAVILPLLVLFFGQMKRLFASGTFTFQLTEEGLRMHLVAPIDFMLRSMLQVRQDRALWLIKDRDQREEWIDITWMGAGTADFEATFTRLLLENKVPVENRTGIPAIKKV